MPGATIPGFRSWVADRLRADTEIVRLAALETSLRAESALVALTDKEGLVDTGFYKARWQHARTPEGAEVFNDAPYAAVIEHGRRPGRPGPPLEPIRAWVLRKLVPNGVVPLAEVDAAAQRIRDKIHFQGTAPRRILARVRPKLLVWFQAAVRRTLIRRRR